MTSRLLVVAGFVMVRSCLGLIASVAVLMRTYLYILYWVQDQVSVIKIGDEPLSSVYSKEVKVLKVSLINLVYR